MKRAFLLLAALLIVLAGARQARADVVLYSNLPASSSLEYEFGPGISSSLTGLAFEFTPTTSGTVKDVKLGLFSLNDTGSYSVAVYTDSSGPGTSLGSTGTVSYSTFFGSAGSTITANVTTSTSLSTSSNYWVAVIGGSGSQLAWSTNTTTTGNYSTYNGSSWTTPASSSTITGSPNSGAFEVDGPSAVPEPTSFALGGLGVVAVLGGCCWRLRKQKAAVAPTLS